MQNGLSKMHKGLILEDLLSLLRALLFSLKKMMRCLTDQTSDLRVFKQQSSIPVTMEMGVQPHCLEKLDRDESER